MSVAELLRFVIAVLRTFRSIQPSSDEEILTSMEGSPQTLAWMEKFVPIQANLPPRTQAQADLTAIPRDVQQMVSPDKLTQFFQVIQKVIELYRMFKPPAQPAQPAKPVEP